MGLGLSQVCAQLLPGLLVVPSLVGQVCMVCVCVHMPVMPVCAQLSVHLDPAKWLLFQQMFELLLYDQLFLK